MSDRSQRWLGYTIVLTLGGLPLWTWFRGDWLLKTSDIRLPIPWAEWSQFWYAWNDQMSTGTAPMFDRPLALYHGLTALVSRWTANPVVWQKTIVVCWFPLAGIGMYRLITRFVSGPAKTAAGVVAASFYLYNLWQETIWLGFKPPLVVGYAVLPFALQQTIEAVNGWSSCWRSAMAIALWSLPAAAMWYNPTEAVAVVAPVAGCILLAWFRDRGIPNAWRRHAGFAILLLGLWTLVNAFWLVPQAFAAAQSLASPDLARVQKTIAWGWLDGISTYTSLPNVLRLQGDWAWHNGCVDPYRPYAMTYLTSPWLWGLSWVTPLIALYALRRSRSPLRALFGILAVCGVVLSAGVHSPVRPLYRWLFDHVPFFWAMRSPYYKFGLWTVLGFSGLLGLAVETWGTRRTAAWQRWGWLGVAVLMAAQLGYAYPVVTGCMFTSARERTFLPPDRIRIPGYVQQTGAWLDTQVPRGRVLTLPGDNVWISSWGYVGIGSAVQAFTNVPVVFPYAPEYATPAVMAANASRELVEAVVRGFMERRTRHMDTLLRMLGVRFLLQENDVRYDFYKGAPFVEHDSPEFMRTVLSEQRGTALARQFGSWDVYEVQDAAIRTTVARQVVLVQGPPALLVSLADTPVLDQGLVVLLNQQRSNQAVTEMIRDGLVGTVVTDGRPLDPRLAPLIAERDLPLWMVISVDTTPCRVTIPRTGTWECRGVVYNERPAAPRPISVTMSWGDQPRREITEQPTSLSLPTGEVALEVHWTGGDRCLLVLAQAGRAGRDTGLVSVSEVRQSPVRSTITLPAGGPMLVAFHESFDPGWELRRESEITGLPLVVNGYAQGWVVPSSQGGISEIEFLPQRVVVPSAVATGLAVLGLVGGLLFGWRSFRQLGRAGSG